MKSNFKLVAALTGCVCVFILTVEHYSNFTTKMSVYYRSKIPCTISNDSYLDNMTVQAYRANSYYNTDNILHDHSRPNICSRQQRLNYIREKCRSLQPEIGRIRGAMITDSKRKLFYCPISKAGCTTWKYLMKKANSQLNVNLTEVNLTEIYSRTTFHGSQWLRKYPKYENYTKFVVIRHPLERILSAYFNSKRPRRAKGEFGPTIKLFKKLLDYRKEETLSLPLFIEAITKTCLPLYTNQHWRPYMQACNFCQVEYDHIIRMETMGLSSSASNHNDAAPILNMLGYNGNMLSDVHRNNRNRSGNPQTNRNIPYDPTSRVLLEYKDVPQYLMDKLLDRYKYDLELFGYSFNVTTLRTACRIPVNEGSKLTCC